MENFLEQKKQPVFSILDTLYEQYSQNSPCADYSPLFRDLENALRPLDRFAVDQIMTKVFDLCAKHERNAYLAGARAGVRLSRELAV